MDTIRKQSNPPPSSFCSPKMLYRPRFPSAAPKWDNDNNAKVVPPSYGKSFVFSREREAATGRFSALSFSRQNGKGRRNKKPEQKILGGGSDISEKTFCSAGKRQEAVANFPDGGEKKSSAKKKRSSPWTKETKSALRYSYLGVFGR